jgi:hypothetical protein
MAAANAKARARKKQSDRASARVSEQHQMAIRKWARFCGNMASWYFGVAAEKPEEHGRYDRALVTAAIEAVATNFLCPDLDDITPDTIAPEADPVAYVVKHMRAWAGACVSSLYTALAVSNDTYRLLVSPAPVCVIHGGYG